MFSNVFFSGTKIGVMTDFDGNFKLETRNPIDSLTVQALGYANKSKKVRKGSKQTLNYQLSPSDITLDEVVILPGENPAFRVLRGVWENKKKYNPDKIDTYKYESYAKVEIALNNVSEKFKNSTTMKPFKSIFDSLKIKAGEDGKIVLPLIASETINDYYYQKNPKYEKELVKASKSKALVNITDIMQPFIGTSQHKYNFYNNWLNLLDKPFASPISTSGRLYYKYYLMDSLNIEGVQCYMMKFKPRRKGDLAFNGKMWITKEGFILKKITVEVGNKANFNFVERMKIEQELELIDSTIVFAVQNRVLVDAANFTSNYGILAKYNLAYQDIVLNPELESDVFIQNQEFAYDMQEKTDEYWNDKRNELVGDSAIADQSYAIIDSLSESKGIKRMSNFIDFVFEGYIPTKYFEFGHYMFFLGYNKDEGFRTQIGGRTTAEFSKKWLLDGHIAYGFKDEKVKYDLSVERFINRKKWSKVGFRYRHDLDKVGVDSDFITQNPLMAFSLALSSQFGGSQNAFFTDDLSAWFRTDLGRGFQTKIMLRHAHMNPYGKYAFAYLDNKETLQNSYILSNITTTLRFAKREMYIHRNNDRFGVGGKKGNIYTLTYTAGLKGVINSSFNYHKVSLNIKRKLKTGGIGRTFYSFTANKVFGVVPPTLLNILQGNESFFISNRGYNKMKFFEFVANESVELFVFHHFDGFFLDKFPLLRALKLRSTAGINIAHGSFEKRYDDIIPEFDLENRPVDRFTRLSHKKPYVEVSVGVENIFRFFSVQYIRRLTYLKGIKDPNAIRFAVHLAF